MSASRAPVRIKLPIYKGRSLEGVCILAGLVGYEIDVDGIERLTPIQRQELEVWAERTHLRASDNPVRVPPRPDWLPDQPWQGAEDEWGRGPTLVDCAAIAKAEGGAT